MPSPVTTLTCDALLFDFDGVLVDSTACVEDTWRRWAIRHGLDADTIVRMAHGRRALGTVRAVAEHRPRHVGLPVAPVLVCADEVVHGKPHPEGYLTAAARLGVSPAACLVVEDAPAGLAAAHAAGMRALAVATTHPSAALGSAELITHALSAVTVRVERSGGRDVLRVALSCCME